ncbi:18639_t:CDS:2 [Rhizophagus irregularis]|nr:18639_t:CDS:2 [Rhizophagus irregularis]
METFLSQNGLSLVENENKFRSIITNKKIDIGKTIIISHPLISFPILTYNKIRCDQCLKKKENNLQTCSKCQRVYYCDRSCQKSSWISHHKLLCPLYKKSKNNMDEEITEQSINNLKSFEKISNNTYENLNFNKISKDDLINYLCVFYCNNFNLHDNQLFVYGEGTFPIGSLFNHSCRPNAIVMYDGAVQIIKCIEVINVGEEINISYIDVALDRVTRKKMLQEKYFFECQCSRCSVQERCSGIFSKIDQLIEEKDQEITKKDFNTSLENWVSSESKLEQNESKFSKVTKLILSNLLSHIKNNTTDNDYINSLSEIISILFQNYSKTNLFYISSFSFTTKLFYDKIDLQQWYQSTILGNYILSIYLIIYPRYHPMIGLHLFTLGKCYWNDITNGLESVKESINILECAQKVLNITHNEGAENVDIINQVNDLLNTARKDLSCV